MEIVNNHRTQQMGLVRQLTSGPWGRDRYLYPLSSMRGRHRLNWSVNFSSDFFSQGFNFYFVCPSSFSLTWYPQIKLFTSYFFLLLFYFHRNF